MTWKLYSRKESRMKIAILFILCCLLFVFSVFYILLHFTEKRNEEIRDVQEVAASPDIEIGDIVRVSEADYADSHTDLSGDIVIATEDGEVEFNLEDGILIVTCPSEKIAFKIIYVALMESFGPFSGFTGPVAEINDVVIVHD